MPKHEKSQSQDRKKGRASNKKRKVSTSKLKKRATFIGIDLAWSERNPTGCAIIRNERLVAHNGELGSNQDIVAFIRAHLETECPAIIGIDAPLRVPNNSGSRQCDRALSAEWRKFDAGALPANRQIFARMNPARLSLADKPVEFDDANNAGTTDNEQPTAEQADDEQSVQMNPVRGEVLVELLTERLRFSESAQIPQQTDDRLVCEIYPHPAHVSLFGLEKILKYKARAGRSYEERWPEFERYQRYLRTLRHANPILKRTKALLTQTDVRQFRGKALKRYEDTLDAISCAYVVYYLWIHGPNYARTYGTLTDGHIIVPLTDAVKQVLAK